MEPRHHLMNPVELFTHCFHHRSAFHDDHDGDNNTDTTDNNYENSPQQSHHRKRNSIPAVTLFYDVDKKLTVAVLSSLAIAIESLAVYFQCRVEQGTAQQRSILYYELEGYIRENYSKIQRQSGLLGPEAISIAVGSLEASDEAQKIMLEEERHLAREQRLHGTSSSSSSTTLEEEMLFEQVMEIARLHRLNDDLDVLSVYFLRQVNKTCGRIATRIAQYQLAHNTTLMISPYVDGVALSGYSNFNRGTVLTNGNTNASISNNSNVVMNAPQEEEGEPANEMQQHHRLQQHRQQQQSQLLVRHRDFGRQVEYRRCKDILLTSTRQNPAIFSPIITRCHDNDDTVQVFTWDCEEIAFAVMHRWWGDIAEREYIGHKLVLSWLLGPSPSSSSSVASAAATTTTTRQMISLPLGTIHLEPSKVKGALLHQHFPISLSSRLTLDILQSHTKVVDDVTVSYKGKARVCQVQVNFLALVRAAARHSLPGLQQDYRHIQESRPLLDHERVYLRRVQDAASL